MSALDLTNLSTSAGSPMNRWGYATVLLAFGSMSATGTASHAASLHELGEREVATNQTSSLRDRSERPPEATASATMISEIRRISGLTWNQLARTLRVSRRSLHFWASGKSVNATNGERLSRILSALKQADRGAADINRAMLFDDTNGTLPIDLLAEEKYDEFVHNVGIGARTRPKLRPLSPEAEQTRMPVAPERLVGALNDPIPTNGGRGRAVPNVGARRRDRS